MNSQQNDLLEGLSPHAISRALQKEPGAHDDIFDVGHTWISVKHTTLLAASVLAFLLCMQIKTPFALLLAPFAVGFAGYACFKLHTTARTTEVAVTRAQLISLSNRKQGR